MPGAPEPWTVASGTFHAVRLGADSGGTFTDVVGTDGRILKIPSTPARPGCGGARRGRRTSAALAPTLLAHGTTVRDQRAAGAHGRRVALVTTEGFADVIEIARQARPSLYDPWADRPAPLVPGASTGSRSTSDSTRRDGARSRVDRARCPSVPDGVEAVAVCLLHADLDPDHEPPVADGAAAPRAGT